MKEDESQAETFSGIQRVEVPPAGVGDPGRSECCVVRATEATKRTQRI